MHQHALNSPSATVSQQAHSQELRDEVLAEVVNCYQDSVYAYLRSRLSQVSDAEDLTQEVFVRYYLAQARFDESRMVRPYLLGIARNLLRERARTLRRRNEITWTEICLEVADCDEELPEGMYDDVKRHLPECLEGLGDNARSAIQMHYGARMKFQDIGKRLRRSVGAVKLLMFRARKNLRRCLDRKMSITGDE